MVVLAMVAVVLRHGHGAAAAAGWVAGEQCGGELRSMRLGGAGRNRRREGGHGAGRLGGDMPRTTTRWASGARRVFGAGPVWQEGVVVERLRGEVAAVALLVVLSPAAQRVWSYACLPDGLHLVRQSGLAAARAASSVR